MSSPLATVNDPIMPTLTGAALVFYAQKFLKTLPAFRKLVDAFPMANKWIHRWIAALGSLITMLGITVTFTGSWDAGWHISGEIPALSAMALALWAWFKIYLTQQMFYEITRKEKPE